MSKGLDWEKAKRDSLAARSNRRLAEKRSRPKYKPAPWIVFARPWGLRTPPRKIKFRRAAKCWFKTFTQRHAVDHALKTLKDLGWKAVAKPIAPNQPISRDTGPDLGAGNRNDRPDLMA